MSFRGREEKGMGIGAVESTLTPAVASITPTGTATSVTSRGGAAQPASTDADSSDISGPAQLLAKLKELQQTDPTKFKAVVTKLSDTLNEEAKAAASPRQQRFLTDLASQFAAAGQTGTLPTLAGPSGGRGGPPPAGGTGGSPPGGAPAGSQGTATPVQGNDAAGATAQDNAGGAEANAGGQRNNRAAALVQNNGASGTSSAATGTDSAATGTRGAASGTSFAATAKKVGLPPSARNANVANSGTLAPDASTDPADANDDGVVSATERQAYQFSQLPKPKPSASNRTSAYTRAADDQGQSRIRATFDQLASVVNASL
jgi:hypothetical protein